MQGAEDPFHCHIYSGLSNIVILQAPDPMTIVKDPPSIILHYYRTLHAYTNTVFFCGYNPRNRVPLASRTAISCDVRTDGLPVRLFSIGQLNALMLLTCWDMKDILPRQKCSRRVPIICELYSRWDISASSSSIRQLQMLRSSHHTTYFQAFLSPRIILQSAGLI